MNADEDDDHQVECESTVAHPPFYAAPAAEAVCADRQDAHSSVRCVH